MMNWKKNKKARTIATVIILLIVAAMIITPIISNIIR